MSRINFLDKTLLAAAQIADQSIFAETYAGKKGLLQALDVRVRLLTFLGILVLISFLHTLAALWVLYLFSVILAYFSRVPVSFFLKRVWLFVPLFSAAIVLPALLNIVTPGDPLLVLVHLKQSYSWGPYTIPAEIAITRQGLHAALMLVSRVATSVSFAVLLTMTARWSAIFASLRSLFLPRIFVMTFSMTERYLFVFLRLIQDMYLARKSRTIKPLPEKVERSWIASRIGVTFKKSIDMSEDVYRAMLSRGFRGEFRKSSEEKVSSFDIIWSVTIIGCGGILLLFEKGFFH